MLWGSFSKKLNSSRENLFIGACLVVLRRTTFAINFD